MLEKRTIPKYREAIIQLRKPLVSEHNWKKSVTLDLNDASALI